VVKSSQWGKVTGKELLPQSNEELLSRVNRNVETVLEDHFVGADEPAGGLVRVEEVL
jgi:hypothetical protein